MCVLLGEGACARHRETERDGERERERERDCVCLCVCRCVCRCVRLCVCVGGCTHHTRVRLRDGPPPRYGAEADEMHAQGGHRLRCGMLEFVRPPRHFARQTRMRPAGCGSWPAMARRARLLWILAVLHPPTSTLPLGTSALSLAGSDAHRQGVVAPRLPWCRNRGCRAGAPLRRVQRGPLGTAFASPWHGPPARPAERGCMQLRGGGLFSSESKSAKDARKAQEAAVAEKNEELEKVLECPTCLNLLYQPITLLCGHSFCGVCLKSWLRSGSRICPMCRAPVEAYLGELHTSYSLASTIRTLFPALYEQRRRETQDAQYFPPKGCSLVPDRVWSRVCPARSLALSRVLALAFSLVRARCPALALLRGRMRAHVGLCVRWVPSGVCQACAVTMCAPRSSFPFSCVPSMASHHVHAVLVTMCMHYSSPCACLHAGAHHRAIRHALPWSHRHSGSPRCVVSARKRETASGARESCRGDASL